MTKYSQCPRPLAKGGIKCGHGRIETQYHLDSSTAWFRAIVASWRYPSRHPPEDLHDRDFPWRRRIANQIACAEGGLESLIGSLQQTSSSRCRLGELGEFQFPSSILTLPQPFIAP